MSTPGLKYSDRVIFRMIPWNLMSMRYRFAKAPCIRNKNLSKIIHILCTIIYVFYKNEIFIIFF